MNQKSASERVRFFVYFSLFCQCSIAEVLNLLGVLMLLWSFAIWPFIIKLSFTVGSDCALTGMLIVKTIGGILQLDWKLIQTASGPQIVLRYSSRKHIHERKMNDMSGINKQTLQAIIHSASIKRHLLSYLKLIRFHANIRLGTNDAANTALLCGFLHALMGCFPQIRGKVTPDFQSPSFCADISCIAPFRLGKLFVSAAMGAFSYLSFQLRHKRGGADHGSTASD